MIVILVYMVAKVRVERETAVTICVCEGMTEDFEGSDVDVDQDNHGNDGGNDDDCPPGASSNQWYWEMLLCFVIL